MIARGSPRAVVASSISTLANVSWTCALGARTNRACSEPTSKSSHSAVFQMLRKTDVKQQLEGRKGIKISKYVNIVY